MSAHWYKGRLAAFDVETTGTDPTEARIVTAAVALVGGGQPTEARAWLVNPGVPIPDEAAEIHGITTERAQAEGREPREAIEDIVRLLDIQVCQRVPIVAFNARYDLTVLDREARRHGLGPLGEGMPAPVRVIDPYVIDKAVDRYRRGRRKLIDLCGTYGATLDDAHEAGADAIAAARLAYRLGTRVARVAALDLDALHEAQVKWAEEQAISLRAYFAQKGEPQHVEGEWPLISARAA